MDKRILWTHIKILFIKANNKKLITFIKKKNNLTLILNSKP